MTTLLAETTFILLAVISIVGLFLPEPKDFDND